MACSGEIGGEVRNLVIGCGGRLVALAGGRTHDYWRAICADVDDGGALGVIEAGCARVGNGSVRAAQEPADAPVVYLPCPFGRDLIGTVAAEWEAVTRFRQMEWACDGRGGATGGV